MKHLSYLSLILSFFLVSIIGEGSKTVFIIFGQGHFCLAYLYMYKSGKINYKAFIRYTLTATLLFVFYFTIKKHVHEADWILRFSTALYFVIHFSLDYYFLNNFKINFTRYIVYLAPLLIAMINNLTDPFILPESTVLYGYPLAFLLAFFKLEKEDYVTKQILFFSFLLYLNSFASIFNISEIALIIIAHYIMWYVFYFLKVKTDTQRLKSYLLNIIMVNSCFILLFLVFKEKNDYIFDVIFGEEMFYLWTWMHYFVTLRLNDFKIK